MSDGGKGSVARPFSVDQKTFADNWDAIFGKKKQIEIDKTKIDENIDKVYNDERLVSKNDKKENTNNDVPEEKDSQENK